MKVFILGTEWFPFGVVWHNLEIVVDFLSFIRNVSWLKAFERDEGKDCLYKEVEVLRSPTEPLKNLEAFTVIPKDACDKVYGFIR